jgi:hypothetical protein
MAMFIEHDPQGEVIRSLQRFYSDDPITSEFVPPEILKEIRKHIRGPVQIARRFWHPYMWYETETILGSKVEDEELPRRVSWYAWNAKKALEIIE